MALPGAHADVVGEPTSNGFETLHRTSINVPREAVFQSFLEIGSWWNAEHSYSLDANNLAMAPEVGGGFVEHIPGGGFVHHLRAITWLPAKLIRFEGGLGPLQENAVTAVMTIKFDDDADGTLITVNYRVAGVVDGGLANWAAPVDDVVAEQFERLKEFAEKRNN